MFCFLQCPHDDCCKIQQKDLLEKSLDCVRSCDVKMLQPSVLHLTLSETCHGAERRVLQGWVVALNGAMWETDLL